MDSHLESLHEQFESQNAKLRQLDLEIYRQEISCRDKDSRREELQKSNNIIKSSNDEVIERIEVHEETKLCMDKEMVDQCFVSNEMLVTIGTVNAKITEIAATHKAEILELNRIIECSEAKLQENKDATEDFSSKQ